MSNRTVNISITFSKDKDDVVSVETNDVPKTLIVEHLQNLSKFFSTQIVEDAETFIPDDKLAEYLDARIKVDREKLKELLKK